MSDLRCEYERNPLGIENSNPRLSWVLDSDRRSEFQSAYQILVSEDLKSLQRDIGGVWDSGQIRSQETFGIKYAGKALESGKRYFWKVRSWDSTGRPSKFSSVSWWEMGLLENWQAKWIQGGPVFRKNFELSKSRVRKARAYISCLGFYELRINGVKVGSRVLDPAPTVRSKRIPYSVYDIASYLRKGENSLRVFLGNGRDSRKAFTARVGVWTEEGEEKIETDESWECSTNGPVIEDHLYNGEKYDANLEDDLTWEKCRICTDPPKGRLVPSATYPPITVTKDIPVRKVSRVSEGLFVLDFGQNFSGWVKLRIRGRKGTEVKLRYAELLNDDGTINIGTNRLAQATDHYILKGNGLEEYEPRFTYHGFRYVEASGFPGSPSPRNFVGRVVHSNVEEVGAFECSNDLLNRIHDNIRWTQKSNLMGVPTDSPQRDERLGWLGDALLSAEESIYNFSMVGFFEKFLQDIADSQSKDGSIPDVAPTDPDGGGRYPADPGWGAAFVIIPYLLYRYYGDFEILGRHYESIKAWVDFELSKTNGYVLERENNNKYGDWCAPGHVKPAETPGGLISTCWLYLDCSTLAQIASLLRKEHDSKTYLDISKKIQEALNGKFLGNTRDANYARGSVGSFANYGSSQTCNLFPLYLGIVPEEKKEEVFGGLVQDVEVTHDSHLNTGIAGTRFFFDVLTLYGRADLAFKVATQRSYPSYGYMVREGATTLWERWEYLTGRGMNSHNHIMFGSIDAWFYKAICGLEPDPASPGFRHYFISPNYFKDLKSASCSFQSVSGKITTSWDRMVKGTFNLRASIPANTTCTIRIPTSGFRNWLLSESSRNVISSSGKVTKNNKVPSGIFETLVEQESVVCRVGSGNYYFTLRDQ